MIYYVDDADDELDTRLADGQVIERQVYYGLRESIKLRPGSTINDCAFYWDEQPEFVIDATDGFRATVTNNMLWGPRRRSRWWLARQWRRFKVWCDRRRWDRSGYEVIVCSPKSA